MNGHSATLSPSALKKLVLAEDIVIGLIMASTLLLFTTKLNSHFTLPKLAAFSGLITILLATFLVRLKSGEYQILPGMVWVPLLLMMAWWLFGTSQAIHIQTALEGQYGRYNGLYLNLLLATLFIVVSSIPYDVVRFRRFLNTLFILMLIVCLYAFVQYIGLDMTFGERASLRPPSSIGNPVAFAVILLLTVPYALAVIWLQEEQKNKIVAGIILLVFITVLYMTGARGPWAGLLSGLLIGFCFLIATQSSQLARKIKILSSVVIGVGVAAAVLVNTPDLYSKLSFETRLRYFDIAIQMIKDSPIFGFGFESFRLTYPLYRPADDILIYGKFITPTMIHNDYLQLAADNGILAMLFYLFFIGGVSWLIVRAIRSDKKYRILHIAILTMLSAYLVQGLSGWLEAASSIIFWLVLAVSIAFVVRRQGSINTGNRLSVYAYSIFIGLGLVLSTSYTIIMATKVKQDFALREIQSDFRYGFRNADQQLQWLTQSSVNNAYYQDQAGIIYTQLMANRPSMGAYKLARKYLLRARELNTYDPYIRFHLIKTDEIALRQRLIAKPSDEVMEEMREILGMDPNNPTVYQIRAGLFAAMGDQRAAVQNIVRMRQLKKLQK